MNCDPWLTVCTVLHLAEFSCNALIVSYIGLLGLWRELHATVLLVFNVRQYYCAHYCYRLDVRPSLRPSVCPSVCPSHTGIVSKRFNLSSNCHTAW